MKNVMMAFAILLLLLPFSQDAKGQNDRFDANFTISQKAFGKDAKPTVGPVKYQVCNTLKMAQDYANSINSKREDLTYDYKTDSRFKLNESRLNGTFVAHVSTGMGVLICNDDDAIAIEIKGGKTDYEGLLKASNTLVGVDVKGKGHHSKFKPVHVYEVGDKLKFNINAYFDPGYTSDNTRMFIQPVVTECQTEDTIENLTPLVYEGRKYHKLQDNRMDFNYHRNDPVAFAYQPEIALRNMTAFVLDTNIIYHKPDPKKTYKCIYDITIEDYTHVIYNNGGVGTGSCYTIKPFKFLNYNVAAADMPLTAEFYDQAESHVRNVPRDLQLRFVVGTDQLTKDSINDVVMRNLAKEMMSYGDRLTQINIEGAASPEGSLQLNQSLAQKRAVVAQKMLRYRLGKKADYVRLPSPTVIVHTWADVADAIEAKGDTSKIWEAREIRGIIARVGEASAYNSIKNLLYYNSDIEPILESQRVMKCSYQYEVDHVMDAGEALAEYTNHKGEYINGTRDLSDGDYYNLFANMTDSLQQDSLVDIAYRHMLRQPSYYLLKLSPYVANRKALKNIRRGVYDDNILKPFIDTTKVINQKINGQIVYNRREMLVNQAITYLMENKIDSAQYLIEFMNDPMRRGTTNGNINPQTEESSSKISMIITFIANFFNEAAHNEEYEKAFNYVLNSSQNNKAALYTELRDDLGKTVAEADTEVEKMDDNDARKWYLKGLLYSTKASLDAGDADIVPPYLAYFQHSFDLQPSFKRYYAIEGNISEDVRKLYPYRRKDIEKYRAAFRSLMAERTISTTGNADPTNAITNSTDSTEEKSADTKEADTKNADSKNAETKSTKISAKNATKKTGTKKASTNNKAKVNRKNAK